MNPSRLHDFEILNPDFSLSKVKGLLFDLDDTLYFIPSGAHFYRYGEHLAEFLPEEEKQAYLKELWDATDAASPLKVGRAFDPKTGWILEFDDVWVLKKTYSFAGEEISAQISEKHYPSGLREQDLEGLIHLASGWAIPTTLAKRRGLVGEHFRKAYLATRTEMMANPEVFPLVSPPELVEFLSSLVLENYILVVATNSDLKDAHDVLERLGIKDFFRQIYGQARKPSRLASLLQEIIKLYELNYEQLLVIGDSVYNDLKDAKILGSQTVLIERYGGQPLGYVDVRVWDFEGFIDLWKAKI